MTEETDLVKKLYYYSAVRSTLERTLRFYFDKELLLAHVIADVSYQMINDRVVHLKAGDNNVPLPKEAFDMLKEGVYELKQAIEKDETTYPALEKLMEIAYLASGPGFYTRSFLDYVNSQHSQEGLTKVELSPK